MSRRKQAMKRKQPASLSGKVNDVTLPVRQGIGRGLEKWRQMSGKHKLGLIILTPLWLMLLMWQPALKQEASPVTGSLSLVLEPTVTRELDIPVAGKRVDHTLAQGETLAALFREWKLPGSDLIALVRAEPSYKPLSHLQAGQQLTLVLNEDGQLLYLEVNDKGLLLNAFRRMGQEFAVITTP